MADDNLDKYLENLGISMEEDEHPEGQQSPRGPHPGFSEDYSGEEYSDEDPSGEDQRAGNYRDTDRRDRDDHDGGAPEPVAEGALGVLPGESGDALERCETFLVNLLLHIDPAYAVELSGEGQGELFAEIYGGDPGKVIGRSGRTLSALEYLTNTVVNQGEDSRRIRVNIDVGGYKRRRDDRLVNTARKAAARVRKTGFAVELEPMSAAERRVVHMELADNPYVYSESTGEGKDRRLVVKPR